MTQLHFVRPETAVFTDDELAALKTKAEAHLEAERAVMTPGERALDHRVPTVCWDCFEPACVCEQPAEPKLMAKRIVGASFIGAGLGIAAALLAGLLSTGCAALQKHGATGLDVAQCVQDWIETNKPIDTAAILSINRCIAEVVEDAITRHDKLTQELTELEAQRVRLLVQQLQSQTEPTHGAEPEGPPSASPE